MGLKIVNEQYQITVCRDVTYTLNSSDNKPYDMEIQALSVKHNSGRCAFYEVVVENFETGSETRIVLIGDYFTNLENDGMVLIDNYFIVILDTVIVELSLDDMQYKVINMEHTLGTYYSIYLYDGIYVVYGDLEVRILNADFHMIGVYSSKDILVNHQKSLEIKNNHICFYDWDGNYHELNMDGTLYCYKERQPTIVNIDVTKINGPKELQQVLKLKLGMPDFYGMNWDAFWDGITGLIQMPDMLILEGWHIYKKRQSEDAQRFERIMKRYNDLKAYKYCECIYKYYE